MVGFITRWAKPNRWGGENKWPEFAERERAFREQMACRSLSCPEAYVATYPSHGAYDNDTAIASARAALAADVRPTAVISGSGSISGMKTAAASLGLTIPGDLSVVAITQCPASADRENTEPDGVSVMEMPVREMARKAVERLLGLIDGRRHERRDREITVEMKLIHRASVAKCR